MTITVQLESRSLEAIKLLIVQTLQGARIQILTEYEARHLRAGLDAFKDAKMAAEAERKKC